MNPQQPIFTVTEKGTSIDMEIYVEHGIGYVSKDVLQKNRVDIGAIALDGVFTPIKKVNYEVENMRVGNRTDFNRLKFFIETDGTLTPKEALEKSIEIMIHQLKAIIGFKEEEPLIKEASVVASKEEKDADPEFLKTRIESVGLSQRTQNALTGANIRTVGGLARKKEKDILDIEGLGSKGVQEIKDKLAEYGITLKAE
jgi:DNA-directed RNA polymerase subunit alpha